MSQADNATGTLQTDDASANLDAEANRKNTQAQSAECEKRLDEIADLITRIRHEINNPLTGVLGQARLLLREDLSESARRRVTTIEEQAIRIRDIVAQLRQVQKGAKGGA